MARPRGIKQRHPLGSVAHSATSRSGVSALSVVAVSSASTGVKISELPAALAASDTDQMEVNQGGVSKRLTLDQVASLVGTELTDDYLPLAGGTMTGSLGIGDYFTLSGTGNPTARLAITAAFTDGAAPPLLDLIDLNMSGATPSTGFDIRFFGRDTNDDVVLGAVINGGMATRTAGAFKGDIDFLVYGAGYVVQAGMALSGEYVGLVPIGDNVNTLGHSTLRWTNVYSTLGNFAGTVTMGATATVATSLSVGGTSAAEAIDLTGNLFMRTAGAVIYGSGQLQVQAGTGQALLLLANAGASFLSWSSGGLLQFGGIGNTEPALKRSGVTSTLMVRQANDAADAPLQALTFSSNSATPILASRTTITGGSTANVPTLTTGPVTGNPTKWLPYDDNGTTRYIPSW